MNTIEYQEEACSQEEAGELGDLLGDKAGLAAGGSPGCGCADWRTAAGYFVFYLPHVIPGHMPGHRFLMDTSADFRYAAETHVKRALEKWNASRRFSLTSSKVK